MMKTITLIIRVFIILLITIPHSRAQFPESFKFQAVARNAQGEVLANEPVNTEIQIRQGSPSGTLVYTELHDSTTNEFGLINLNIGQGNPGDFQQIDWSNAPYFIRLIINDQDMGASELLSVPYALHAKTAESAAHITINGDEEAFDGWDKDASDDFDGDYTNLLNRPVYVSLGGVYIQGSELNTVHLKTGTVAIGTNALLHNGEGTSEFEPVVACHNTAVGMNSLLFNNSGFNNTSVGYNALYNNTTANNNTAQGYEALKMNSTGSRNTATGAGALTGNTTGTENSAHGNGALHANTGSGNTASGSMALYLNKGGSNNTAIGLDAASNNTLGNSNVAIGAKALHENTDRGYLVAIGDSALYFNGTDASSGIHATQNVAVGSKALLYNSNGYRNTGIGYESLKGNSSGNQNTAVGFYSLHGNSTGEQNTAVGVNALFNAGSGSYNTAIGTYAGPASESTNLSNTTAIGHQAVVTQSNKVRIGNIAVTVIEGQVPWSNPSDRRLKENIHECELGLDFIAQVQTVDYTLKADEENKLLQGVIAQDIEALCQKLGVSFSGLNIPDNEDTYYSVSYATFVIPLINAVKELNAENEQLRAELNEIKTVLETLKK